MALKKLVSTSHIHQAADLALKSHQDLRAEINDAEELSRLDSGLAAHIGAAPVLMSGVAGRGIEYWESWLSSSDRVVLLAMRRGNAVGFIKAQEPQDDVSFAIHDDSTLAINGMYVRSENRRSGAGTALLAAMALHARSTGKEIVSVDCETTNPEAYGFWSRWFLPVTWSLERRL